MTDYSSLRLKRNAELQEALSNVRKDLYDFKGMASQKKPGTRGNHVPPVRLKSLESSSGSLVSTKRTESASETGNDNQKSNRPQSASEKSQRHKSTNSDAHKLKSTSHMKLKRPEPTEFLASFPVETIEAGDKYEEKLYLSQRGGGHVMTSKRSPNKIEADLVN